MSKSDRVELLYIDVTPLTRTQQFLLCSACVFVFFLLYGYMQELLFQLPGFKPFGLYLTLVQFCLYSIFAVLERAARSESSRKIPLLTYMCLAFYTVATMALSNASVGYLNYPTQVIFKCCKLIPVLIGGIVIQGKRHGWMDFIAALMMSGGLILFTLADNRLSPNFDTKGYIMISLALVADAVIGNVQEKEMKSHGASNSEVVLFSYSIGSFYIFVACLVTQQMQEAFWFFAEHPKETYGYAVIFSVTGYLGINLVLTLVKQFGAFVAVTVTTCRKAVTIILSFIFFAKPFSFQYVWAGLIVLAGIYLNLYSKNKSSWNNGVIQSVQKLISCWQKLQLRRTYERKMAESV